jgi:hypothetical protein
VVVPRGGPSEPSPSEPVAASIVGIGSRVAVVPSPGAVYTVLAATAEQTDIAVRSGAVTARLYPGASPHRLRLIADQLEATATGTIYTLVMPPSLHPYAIVHEGRVHVRDRDGEHAVSAGQSWPAAASSPGSPGSLAIDAAAHRLAQHALIAAPVAPTAPPAGGSGSGGPADEPAGSAAPDVPPAGQAPGGSAQPPAGAVTPASGAEDRWRRARQLRGQGHPREALEILDELGKRGDAVWSPIAIAEAMRIHGSVLADPRAVVQLGDAFLGRYPGHALVREVTGMLCRAHRALGETELPSACLMRGVE